MKNNFLLVSLLIFVICVLSCKFENPDAECGNDNQVSENYYVNFINNSSYSVSVYLSNSRNPENFFVEIPANSQQKKELPFLGEETRTFYFVYNLNFGIQDFSFPYYDDKSYKVVSVNKNKINNCKIDENLFSKTNLSFIFLENLTTSDIYLQKGDTLLFPYKSEAKFVSCEDIGGYIIEDEVKKDEGSSKNLSLPLKDIKINVGGGETFADFPAFDYKLGFIYHITCTDEGAKLTSINHLDKSEHEFCNWKITEQPTETKSGKREKKCSVCNYLISEDIEFICPGIILQSSPKYEINDDGQYGLEESSKSILKLSSYSKYMNDDYVFVFDVKISYEAYWIDRWWLWETDEYEAGNKQVFLFKKDPGTLADSLNMVNSNSIRSKYGLLKEETWDDDKGVKEFRWEIKGSECTNEMCIKYDAWGDGEDTWYVISITVDLLIKPK